MLVCHSKKIWTKHIIFVRYFLWGWFFWHRLSKCLSSFKLPFSTNRHQQMACNTRPKIQLKDFRPGGDLKEKKPPTGRKFLKNPHGFCWIHFFGTTKGVYIFCLPTLRMDPMGWFFVFTYNEWLIFLMLNVSEYTPIPCKISIMGGKPMKGQKLQRIPNEGFHLCIPIVLKSWHLWRLQTWDFRSFQPLVGPGI